MNCWKITCLRREALVVSLFLRVDPEPYTMVLLAFYETDTWHSSSVYSRMSDRCPIDDSMYQGEVILTTLDGKEERILFDREASYGWLIYRAVQFWNRSVCCSVPVRVDDLQLGFCVGGMGFVVETQGEASRLEDYKISKDVVRNVGYWPSVQCTVIRKNACCLPPPVRLLNVPVRYCYHIECRGCRIACGLKCDCISLDHFGYAVSSARTICLVCTDHGPIMARVDFVRLYEMKWVPLPVGDHSVWQTGWKIRVSGGVFEQVRGHVGFERYVIGLHTLRFVPLLAFRKLKVLVRLLQLSKRSCVQHSPARYCGGREVVRLSQTTSTLGGFGGYHRVYSFYAVLAALACPRRSLTALQMSSSFSARALRLPPRQETVVLQMYI